MPGSKSPKNQSNVRSLCAYTLCGNSSSFPHRQKVTLLPDSGQGGKLSADLEGRDDKADEAAIFAGIHGTVGCPAVGVGCDAGAEDNPVPLGPHPLGDAQGHDLAGLLAPALLRLPVVAAGPDVAGCERLGPLYEIALIVEAVAEYVGPVHFVPVPDWYIVPPLTQRTRWD